MKDSAMETRGKGRQDSKVHKEDPDATHEDQAGAAKHVQKKGGSEPPKRGRPRKAENKEHEESDAEEHQKESGVNGEEELPKKTKQQKQEHNEDMNGDHTYTSSFEDFEKFVQQLQNHVSVEEAQIVLEENGLDTMGSDEQVYQRSGDLLFFGTCEMCPSCGSALEFAGHSYQCSGYSTEWAKCNFSAAEGRKGEKAKVPSKLKNDFLKKWMKSHEVATRLLDPSDKPFSGMIFVLGGRMSRPQGEIRKTIEKYGGRVVNTARKGVTALLTADYEVSRGGSSKMEDATDMGLPICRESWLYDSVEKMQAQPLDGYNMAAELPGDSDVIPWDKRPPEEEAAAALMADLKLVGKRGVYKDTELEEDGGEIYEKDNIIYNCAFSVCDIHLNLNQYAVLQLIEMGHEKKGTPIIEMDDESEGKSLIEMGHESKGRRGRNKKADIYLYVKEGRVGDRRGVRERLDLQDSPQAAVKEFVKVFEQLTGNEFLAWEREKKFTKKRNKYFPLDMAPGVDVRAGGLGVRQLGVGAAHSKVDSRVVEYLKILFSQTVYRYAMTEIGVDAPDFPTGNLTDWHIDICKQYLIEFGDFLKGGEDNEQKKEQMCLEFSNKWFTLLHSTRPFVIHDLNQLAELASSTLETVRDISHASQLLGDMTGDTLDDPIGDRYAKMDCEMTPLDREGEDFKMILKYFSKTMEPLKYADGEYTLFIEDIVQLESKAAPSLEDIQKVPNRMLLWCGMRTSNLVATLHRGMLPAPLDAPAPGYSFGKGIYCTDAACKAAQYGFTAVDRAEGFLMLAIVGLGDRLELTAPEKPVKEYEEAGDCVKINGKKAPDSEDEYFTWKYDVTVPCGTLQETHVKGVRDFMDFNEYVAYSSERVKPMFLVRTRYEGIAVNAPQDGMEDAEPLPI